MNTKDFEEMFGINHEDLNKDPLQGVKDPTNEIQREAVLGPKMNPTCLKKVENPKDKIQEAATDEFEM